MKLTTTDLKNLAAIAVEAAKKAALLISEYSTKSLRVEKKSAEGSLASQVVTDVDRMSQDIILEALEPTLKKYDLGVLTEESDDDKSRLTKEYFWCIDPLDGTLSFTERKVGYSVSIALVSRTGVPVIGIVVNPVNNAVYVAIHGNDVFKNGKKFEAVDFIKSQDQFTLICDRTMINHENYKHIVADFESGIIGLGYKSLVVLEGGGAVMNACKVLEHAPACYFKLPKKTKGGGCYWDYAATTCIFNETGAIASDFTGQALQFNGDDSVFMNENGVIFCLDERVKNFVIKLNEQL